jgi:glycosyltransferase involved in cell wall biosynthesis
MALPAVSICIPTYNYAHYLTDAVRSACEQTHPDLEVLIIDDASTDGTAALMERLSRKDPRVRCVHNPRNLGLQANFNRCVELAAHECVKILCADDVLRPTCVALWLPAPKFRWSPARASSSIRICGRGVRRPTPARACSSPESAPYGAVSSAATSSASRPP